MRVARAALVAIACAACGAREPSRAPSPAWHLEGPPLDFHKVMLDGGIPAGRPRSARVAQADALEDIRFLEFFMRHAYAPWSYLASTGRVDFDRWFSELRAKIRTQGSWTVGDLFEALRPLVEDVVDDGHLALILPAGAGASERRVTGHRWKTWVFDDRAIDPATCELPRHARLLPAQTFVDENGRFEQPVLLARDPVATVRCADAAHSVREIVPSGHAPPGPFTEQELDHDTYYVRVGSFAPLAVGLARDFQASAERARRHATVVLDLRANAGGDPARFVRWVVSLGVKGVVKTPHLVSVKSFAATVLDFNFLERTLSSGRGGESSRALLERRERARRLIDLDVASGDIRRFTMPEIHVPDDETPSPGTFEGRLQVIVDAKCASACEIAVLAAKHHDGIEVLSETNTAGVEGSGEALPLSLPSSSILVLVPTLIVSSPEVNAFDGIGVAPDLWIDARTMSKLFP